MPPFARATAVHVLKEQLKDSELKTILADENEVKARAAELLDSHANSQRQEKTQDPARFAVASAPEKSSSRSPQKSVQGRTANGPIAQEVAQVEKTAVEFKQVQVRTIDPHQLAALRGGRKDAPTPMTASSPGGKGTPVGVWVEPPLLTARCRSRTSTAGVRR